MSKFDYENFNKRYDKFKKNNLPTPFWDDERQTHEYVYYENIKHNGENLKQLSVYNNLTDALGKIAGANLYYPFTSKNIISYKENGKIVTKTNISHSHAHSFDEVVKSLYYSPESFNIPKDEEQYYSSQQLKYLKRVQKYLLLIGIKDFENENISVTRYRNKLHKKYQNAYIRKLEEEDINKIISGEVNFIVSKYNPNYSVNKKYKPKENLALIIDKNENFIMFLDFTRCKISEYKEIKNSYKIKDLKDNEKVVIKYFKILEIFK
ncbi:MAG: hypothetical protein E7168_05955 [Firmicutes bacterium]|nr:hypothetical protein [Bacillota bacterium]